MTNETNNTPEIKEPSLFDSIFPLVILIALMGGAVYVFGDSSSFGPNQISLLIATGITAIIGMKNGYDYGHLGSGEYAMSFQMDTTPGRGWWWGTSTQTDDQGVMALTNDGRLNVSTSISIGEGKSTTSPSTTPLYVEGIHMPFIF